MRAYESIETITTRLTNKSSETTIIIAQVSCESIETTPTWVYCIVLYCIAHIYESFMSFIKHVIKQKLKQCTALFVSCVVDLIVTRRLINEVPLSTYTELQQYRK